MSERKDRMEALRRIAPAHLFLVTWLVTACSASRDPARTQVAEPPPTASSVSVPPAAGSSTADSAPAVAASPASCGALGCRLFDTPEQAFSSVLEQQPMILGVGEAHAQKGTEGIPSVTRRFSESLLPSLRDKASDLIIELWLPDPRCIKKAKQVEARQKPVTEKQAEGTQDEYVVFGKRSQTIGIKPHALRPTCEQYDQIVAAGDSDVGVMLSLIARQTAAQAKALLAHNQELKSSKLVVLYGGALHNDLEPRPGRESWSFGPELQALSGGRYIELDLIVPEFIKDNENWRSLPWYPHFDPEKHPTKTTLFNPRPGSYVLIFPRTAG